MLKFIILLHYIFFLYSQSAPPNLNGENLKEWLRKNTYESKTNISNYKTAQKRLYNYIYNEKGSLEGVYSGYSMRTPYGGNTSYPKPINCEHTVPQSFFNYNNPMKSDLHHLYPVYERWNSTRSNNSFAEIPDNKTVKWMYKDIESKVKPAENLDEYAEYYKQTFEPRESHKGNLARAIFYFFTMYPKITDKHKNVRTINDVCDIKTLYIWHLSDPVDKKELERNTLIDSLQGNRNPYIDNPSYVSRAWNLKINLHDMKTKEILNQEISEIKKIITRIESELKNN
jgi:hypothetical protein